MITSIVVALDGSAYGDAAREHAVELAGVYGARIVGLIVADVRLLEMSPLMGGMFPGEAQPMDPLPMQLFESYRQGGEQTLEAFRAAVDAAGVPVDVRLDEGVPAKVIAEVGDAFDLIVMGRRGAQAKFTQDLLGSTTEAVVRRAGTPVLLTGETYRRIANVLLLFDGSRAATHALKLAADLCQATGWSLRVLTVGDDSAHTGAILDEARTYLEAGTYSRDFHAREGEPVFAVLEDLDDHPADLVLMGMQGHSFLHDLILGSTTEQLMREIDVPLLLAP
jgi:nucleotide-binding universal stress UspA family protein